VADLTINAYNSTSYVYKGQADTRSTEPSEAGQQTKPASSVTYTQQEDTPSIFEKMQEAREKAQAQRDKFESLKPTQQYGMAPIEAYSRLSRARTPAQASSAAGYARQKIAQLQRAKHCDTKNSRQIKSAINQLQKAAARACKKRRELEQDIITEKRRVKLDKEKQLRKARRLRQQLNNRRSMRSIRESGYFREVEIENRFQQHMAATEMALRSQMQSISDSFNASVSQDAAIQQYAAQAHMTEAAPAAAPEISVQA